MFKKRYKLPSINVKVFETLKVFTGYLNCLLRAKLFKTKSSKILGVKWFNYIEGRVIFILPMFKTGDTKNIKKIKIDEIQKEIHAVSRAFELSLILKYSLALFYI